MPYEIFERFRETYENRPFQGQVPEDTKVFFIGIDANYDVNMSDDFLDRLNNYHQNGVAYWLNNWQDHNNNNHHPFLLTAYRQQAGYQYHLNFRTMDLPANTCADAISFFELLNVPTIGNRKTDDQNGLFTQSLQYSLDHGHIRRLRTLLFTGRNKLVFMPDEVIKILRGINAQAHIVSQLKNTRVPARELPRIYEDLFNNITIYKNLHFSAPFHQQEVLEQLPVIKQRILAFLYGLH
jgi:hypothetical protein